MSDIKYFSKINDRDIRMLTLLGRGIKSTRMAELCGILQPRISIRLDALENDLGQILNADSEGKRSYKSVLTDNGIRVVEIATKMDDLFCELRECQPPCVEDANGDEIMAHVLANDLRAIANRLERYNKHGS